MHQQQQQQPQKKSLFKEKVVVCKEKFADIRTDVVINFCAPDVLAGPAFFEQLHQMAGPQLIEECQNFIGLAPTSCRVTNSFAATNFKLIAHTVVPIDLDLSREIDLRSVYLSVRNSLDRSSEEGATTIAFPSYFPGIDLNVGCELILRIFTDWIHRSPYSDQIEEIKVICPTEKEYNSYVLAARNLYSQANIVGENYVPSFMRPKTVIIPARYLNYNERSFNRAKRSRGSLNMPPVDLPPIKLELSAKLAPTILVIDDENGMKRQYRLTNRSRDGRKLYFRCSRCDTLIKKDGHRIRAKLIVQDGHIVSERFPEHHPDCAPKSHEDVFMQQIDRSSRREVKDGTLMPQDAYKKAVSRVLEESALEPEVNGAVEKFPDWPRLRQQYCRIRKTAIGKQCLEQEFPQRFSSRDSRPARKYSPSYEQDMHYGVETDEESFAMMKSVPIKGEDLEEDDGPIVVDDDVTTGKGNHSSHQFMAADEEMLVEGTAGLPHKES
uniref:Macro domain-containing protein n=1 Tax=Ditylenchus dipsaci TaxID=166011 RepID=A0A915CZW9_9BILA